jgi:phospholipid/cholesterol/gamma-HCH transport system permease protein
MITWNGLTEPLGLFFETLGQAHALLRQPTRRVVHKQLYFCGVQLLVPGVLLGTMIGLIVAALFTAQLGPDAAAGVPLLSWLLFKEVGPVLVALLLVAHSIPAIASELAMMKLNGEIHHLQVMRIPPLGYLVLPRMLGVSVALVTLTFIANCAAMLSAALMLGESSPSTVLLDWLGDQSLADFLLAAAKSLLFGLATTMIACARGFSVRLTSIEVPIMASRAVLHSLLTVLVLDGIWAVAANLLEQTKVS